MPREFAEFAIVKILLNVGCYRVVVRLISGCFAHCLLETRCFHLVIRLMTVTDLLQVVPTRLIQAVRNKLLRACCHQLVKNLLPADDIRLVGTTCFESFDLMNLDIR